MLWRISCGPDDDGVTVPRFDMAIDFMVETIQNANLPQWRRVALTQQAQNMPRAGFSFTDEVGDLIRVEMVRR